MQWKFSLIFSLRRSFYIKQRLNVFLEALFLDVTKR